MTKSRHTDESWFLRFGATKESATIATTDGVQMVFLRSPNTVWDQPKHNPERVATIVGQFQDNVRIMAAGQALLDALREISKVSKDPVARAIAAGAIALAAPPLFNVTADRKLSDGAPMVMFTGTHNECFEYILRSQGQSVDYALKHGGWNITPA